MMQMPGSKPKNPARLSPALLLAFGQVQLTLSGANLLLSRKNGKYLTINGVQELVPESGPTLAPPAVASTLYYIYAYMSGSGMALENSATAYALQSSTGMMTKSGDTTRTLVGMARTTAANAWADSLTQRFVRTWFNDPGITGGQSAYGAGSTASTTLVELDSAKRVEFIAWANEWFNCAAMVTGNSSGVNYGDAAIGIDNTTAICALARYGFNSVTASATPIAIPQSPSEGYHYFTPLYATVAANNINRNDANISMWSLR